MNSVPIPDHLIGAKLTDPGPGEHLWTILTMHRVGDSAVKAMAEGRDPGTGLLDHENLLTVEGPGCFKCEETFSKRTYHRRCTGSM